MKILITGSSGFIGTYLVKELGKKYSIVPFDIKNGEDIFNAKLLAKKLNRVDLVIHLAAFISASESWEKPMEFVNNNTMGTLKVINEAINSGVKKFIFFSSASVKAKPFTPYALSKRSAEEIVKLYSDKIKTIIVRPENIYGIGQRDNYGYVIHNFIKSVKSGNSINIYGTGKQSRDFIYIDDVIKVVTKLIMKDIKSGSILSLGTGKQTNIINLAKIMMSLFDKQVKINILAKRKEPYRSVANLNALIKLGFKPGEFTKLQTGILNIARK